jgi:hypothetical protein
MHHRPWTRLFAVIPLALAAISVGLSFRPVTAHACSCMMPPAAVHQLGAAQVAFVGTPVAMTTVEPTEDQWETQVYRFTVQQAVKGELPATVDIHTSGDSSSCGVTFEIGTPIGLLPYGSTVDGDPYWSAGLCGGVLSPEELLAAADEELPAPTSVQPIASLVGGRYGPAGIVALDAAAQPVGWVLADDSFSPSLLAACPGGETALALAGYDDPVVATIDLHSLTITGRRDLPPTPNDNEIGWNGAARLTCTSPDGADATVFVSALEYGPPALSRVAVLSGDSVMVHGLGRTADLLTVDATTAFAVAEDSVLSIDLSDGTSEVIATLPDQLALSVVADGADGLTILTASGRQDFVYTADSLVHLPRTGDLAGMTATPIDSTRVYSGRLTVADEGWLMAGLENGIGLLSADGTVESFNATPFLVSGGVLVSDFESDPTIRAFDGSIIDIGVPIIQPRSAVAIADGVVPTAALPSTSAMRGDASNGIAAAEPGPADTVVPDGGDDTTGGSNDSGDWVVPLLLAALAVVALAVVVVVRRRRTARTLDSDGDD